MNANASAIALASRENPHFFEKVANTVPGIVVVYNINSGEYMYVNDAVKKILGYSPRDFLSGGLPFVTSLVHPDDIPEIIKKNNAALIKANSKKFAKQMNESIVQFEYRMKHKDGSWKWLQTDGGV